MKKIVESVPNFSAAIDKDTVEKIVECFRAKDNVKLLDYSSDMDHNRTVVTVVGEPEALKDSLVKAIGIAIDNIDMTKHKGQHPRMGAVDVCPLIPIENVTMEECVELSKALASELYDKYNLPSFLYEDSATATHRKNLAKLRKGEFEGMSEKVKTDDFKPDFGKDIHPTAGIVAIGARTPLVAYNVNLNTSNLDIADKIAKKVRHLGGGLRFCKAIGIYLEDRQIAQVSMNLTNYEKTPIYAAFEMIKMEAKRYGVTIAGSEVIGLLPNKALIDVAEYYLGIEEFSNDQILENNLRK